jgi:GDPmannose 4,6-dehydratase
MTAQYQRFLVTGANGQDGTYLVRRLLFEGHEVHGMCHSAAGAVRLERDFPEVSAHVADLSDAVGMTALIDAIEPTHLINLAGNTSVARSWQFPSETAEILGVGPVRLLDAAWQLGERTGRRVAFVQASSAEIFGDATDVPQTESSFRRPVTPYGAAKSFAHEMVGVYRKRGMFASSAVLYNHESPNRPASFVSRKITREVARISLGLSDRLTLGNIHVHRDWGYAPDYVDALLRISRAEVPNDFIVATGVSHSVRDFVAAAFRHVGIEEWDGFVRIDPAFYRPADPKELVGDPQRLRDLGWAPTVTFEELVHLMVDSDLADLQSSAP